MPSYCVISIIAPSIFAKALGIYLPNVRFVKTYSLLVKIYDARRKRLAMMKIPHEEVAQVIIKFVYLFDLMCE